MNSKIDLLNRNEYVEKINKILDLSFDTNKPICLALDGPWGSGKSFIFDKIVENDNNDYIFIKYDSWEKDFYDEPLIAMLYTFACQLNELRKDPRKIEIISKIILDDALSLLYHSINIISKKVLGIEIAKIGKEYAKKYKELQQKDNIDYSFNDLLGVEEAKKYVKEAINKLTQKVKLVILVDEIDRCLPEYALKVLERLHHFIIGNNNTNVIVALDKKRLGAVIGKIYNDIKFDEDKYFQKFFDYTIKLKPGKSNGKFDDRYYEYLEQFTNTIPFINAKDVDEFKNSLVGFGNIREFNIAVEKAFFIHKLLFSEKIDYSFQCVEILLSYLSIIKRRDDPILDYFGESINTRYYRSTDLSSVDSFFPSLRLKFQKINVYPIDGNKFVCTEIRDLWSLIKCVLQRLCSMNGRFTYTLMNGYKNVDIDEYIKQAKKFYEYTELI